MDSGNRIVRIGVIGAGRVAEIYHLPVLAKMPDARLTWICDLDKTRALKLARAYLSRAWRCVPTKPKLAASGERFKYEASSAASKTTAGSNGTR